MSSLTPVSVMRSRAWRTITSSRSIVGARRTLSVACVSLAFLLGACATYQAPELPDSQLATIGIGPDEVGLRFISVDGVYLSATGGLNSFVGHDDLKLAPGKRAVQVEQTEISGLAVFTGGALLVFEARAGQRYLVHKDWDGRNVNVWLTSREGAKVPLLDLTTRPVQPLSRTLPKH